MPFFPYVFPSRILLGSQRVKSPFSKPPATIPYGLLVEALPQTNLLNLPYMMFQHLTPLLAHLIHAYLEALEILPAGTMLFEFVKSSLNNSSSDAFEKESSKAPAAVPAAISGACCPGLQANKAVLLISLNLFTIFYFEIYYSKNLVYVRKGFLNFRKN
jgi:hypothetical protein